MIEYWRYLIYDMKNYRQKKFECIQKLESVKMIIQESREEQWMKMTIEDLKLASQSGGEPMEWDSPDKPGYRFLITRHENSIPNMNQTEAEFTIKIAIYDTFYNYITTISCSEIDIAAMMDSVEVFIYEFDHEPDSSMSTLFQVDSHGMLPELLLYRDYDNVVDENTGDWKLGYYDEKNELPRDIKFSILFHNVLHPSLNDHNWRCDPELVTFYLSDEELCDFMYDLFFVGLIDLDISSLNLKEPSNLDEDIGKMFLKQLPDNPDYY